MLTAEAKVCTASQSSTAAAASLLPPQTRAEVAGEHAPGWRRMCSSLVKNRLNLLKSVTPSAPAIKGGPFPCSFLAGKKFEMKLVLQKSQLSPF